MGTPGPAGAAGGGPVRPGRPAAGWLEVCACPECGRPAEVAADADAPSRVADLVTVRCVQRHWFVGPRSRLVDSLGR